MSEPAQPSPSAEIRPTIISVPRVGAVGWAAFPSARAASPGPSFPATALPFSQPWLPAPEPAFRPGTAWLTATADAFIVTADLADEHIETAATEHHEPLWERGDVFEIFLKAATSDDYFEFHVAPNGRVLQLHYPQVGAPRGDGIERYIRRDLFIEVAVVAQPELRRWRVAVKIPIAALQSSPEKNPGSDWRFAFCRYDYPAEGKPSLSSSAPLTRRDFHRIGEWTRVIVPGGFSPTMPGSR